MSSEEGALPNCTTPEGEMIRTCYMLLRLGEYIGVGHIVNKNQFVRGKWHDAFEKAGAIADVLHAAENRLPNGLLDCYGILRVTPGGPVLREDYEKLRNLLDWRHNYFPFCHEAGVRASLAWSLLSSPVIKAVYDYIILKENNLEPQGTVLGAQGCSQVRVDKRKRKMDSLICSDLPASEYLKGSQAMNVNPLPPAEKRQAPHNQGPSKDTSFVPEKRNAGPGIDVEVVVISDDEDVDRQDISMALTSQVCVINGRRVRLMPVKKKKQK